MERETAILSPAPSPPTTPPLPRGKRGLIRSVFSRASSWVEACCAAGHGILLGRSHVWGPVLSRGNEVALSRAGKRQLLLGNHHHL